jgi:hypothetical protein
VVFDALGDRAQAQARARLTTARTTAPSNAPVATSRTNERSILRLSTGRSRRKASDVKPAPKSSIATRSPMPRSSRRNCVAP